LADEAGFLLLARAFSSEVDAGSRKENASNKNQSLIGF
jgi:hypothetical protein